LGGAWLSFAGAQEIVLDPIHGVVDCPPAIARWAIPSNNHRYFGYWVGGGALSRRKGDAPAVDEGTWGWDYRGQLLPRRVDLLWWHGRRYQGGVGAYKTDGPHLPHLPHGAAHSEGHDEGHGEGHSEGKSPEKH